MRVDRSATEITYTFDSVGELAALATKHADAYMRSNRRFSPDWHGVATIGEARKLAIEGWADEAQLALDIATQAVDTVEREHEFASFHPVWDVAGCEVDVARYLAREPENMIDYEIVPATKVGRVIVLCASISVSSVISRRTIKKRGHAITALAIALSRLGYAVELWADRSAQQSLRGGYKSRLRTLVKGPNDALDPALIMFAFSHAAMMRALCLPAEYDLPPEWKKAIVDNSHGYPIDPKRDLPDGTIYLPSLRSDSDVPSADKALLGYLRGLGILND